MGSLSAETGSEKELKVRFHTPVLLAEALKYLNIKKGEKYLDATVGGGGHAAAILKKGGKVLGIDCDPEAIKAAREYLSRACPAPQTKPGLRGADASWRLAQGNFRFLAQIAREYGFQEVAGILFDLGVSSHQLETPRRGFSFRLDGPLDMRMDPSLKVTAADLVNGLSKGELNELFSRLGQEKYSRRLADALVRARRIKPIETCRELAAIIVAAQPGQGRRAGKRDRRPRLHPATRVFQALRIAVNDELNNLKEALPPAVELLKPKGRLVVISFHSGEDRLVKQFFKENQSLKILTKKPVRPTEEEREKNPRSRSAKLRAAEKK